MEKLNLFGYFSNRYLVMLVFPAPDGAVMMMIFCWVLIVKGYTVLFASLRKLNKAAKLNLHLIGKWTNCSITNCVSSYLAIDNAFIICHHNLFYTGGKNQTANILTFTPCSM